MTRRKLPSQYNHLLAENNPSKDDLVELRRLGQTKLMTNSKPPSTANGASSPSTPQMTLFSYVHLRAPLPHDINPEIFGNGTKPEAYFLMRRSKDGYVSSTGMFKASFPWASKSEEEMERRFVKNSFDASTEETAGNLWVHPDDALSLASDYRCRVWIEALVDDRPVNSDPRNKAVTPPPPYKPTSASSLSPSSAKGAPAATTTTRSASPTRKIAQPRKPRAAKAAAAAKELSEKLNAPAPASSNGDAAATTTITTTTTTATTETTVDTPVVKSEDSSEDPAEETVSNTVVKSELQDGDVKAEVEVETTTEKKGDDVIESTHIKVEIQPSSDAQSLLPETPEDIIAKAKEMVAEAMKDASETTSNKKRKLDESSSQDIPNIETLEISSPKKSKRARVIDVITEEKFQKRALIGISATVALG
ncbi:hypothetical protein H072_2698 [Dactylellina haptotyla CBS 200.50]|uniref:HTH APSES-type domain-containing protein n=1 Tax=Dactylellina haptotyla (strain CBS 200.50) TaxID=1284197 RepID=S8AQF2_DACHA|nr:hypothetical protein H072_2698 [Dactylellina haptotyla CBS 200.50]